MISHIRKHITLYIWLLFLITYLILSYFLPEYFSLQQIIEKFKVYGTGFIIIYFLILCFRSFTLVPSTPLVIAATALHPEHTTSLFFISMAGVYISAIIIYYFSTQIGIEKYFQRKSPRLLEKVKTKLNSYWGPFYICGWAFFPLVPTDLACYIAGSIRMNILLYSIAIIIGESILKLLAIYGTVGIISIFFEG